MKAMSTVELDKFMATTVKKIGFERGTKECRTISKMFYDYCTKCQEQYYDTLYRCKIVSEDDGLARIVWATGDEDGNFQTLGIVFQYDSVAPYGTFYYEGNPKHKFKNEEKIRRLTVELIDALGKGSIAQMLGGRLVDILYFDYSSSYAKVSLIPSPRDPGSLIVTVVGYDPQNHSLGLDGMGMQIRNEEDLTSNWNLR